MRRLHWFLFVGWTLLALVVLWQYDLVGRKLDADASFMLYAGQQILRGHAPYVGVAIVKLPVSPLVATAGVAAGRAFGLDDLLAGRLAFWLCAGLTVGAVYWIGARLGEKDPKGLGGEYNAKTLGVLPYLAGSLSAAALLSSQALGVQVAEGPEAKLPMICAGMFCVVFLAHRKFFGAGVAGVLSFMAWQPGLVFVVVTLVCAALVQERRRAVLSAVGGVALPVVLIGAYLAMNGALVSMFRQAFGANANYFGEKKVAAGIFAVVMGNMGKLWQVSRDCSTGQVPLIALGYVGMLAGAAWLGYRVWKTRDVTLGLSALPLVVSGAALFGFSLLDLQKCSDLTPLLPYLALGAGGAIATGLALVFRVLPNNARLQLALGVLVVAVVLFFGTRDAFAQPKQTGLAQQRVLATEIVAQLGATDTMQQFGDTVVLVLTGRENATRFVHLGEKQGLGILTAEGISMEQLTRQLEAAHPRVITLSRAKNKEWAQPLYDWLESNYRLDSSYGASEGGLQKETDVYWLK